MFWCVYEYQRYCCTAFTLNKFADFDTNFDTVSRSVPNSSYPVVNDDQLYILGQYFFQLTYFGKLKCHPKMLSGFPVLGVVSHSYF